MTFSWGAVAERIATLISGEQAKPVEKQLLDAGQRASLSWICRRISQHGVLLADEVGTGKTRIACALVHAVIESGGRAAVVVPHGLMHQWASEAKRLSASATEPKTLTTFTEFVQNAPEDESEWKKTAPNPEAAEWWLISQGFRSPQVREGRNPAEWRLALPTYVQLWLTTTRTRTDRRTIYGKLHADPHVTLWRIASDIAKTARGDRQLRRELQRLPPFRRGGNNSKLVAGLRGEGDGREVIERLFGLWLGGFDLVVIDEAHKSRDELASAVGETEIRYTTKVLGRLLENILRRTDGGRRLCLTATPMELELSQWLDLLVRARSRIDLEHGRNVVNRLHDMASRAAVAPDETARLEDLCSASIEFTRTLTPFVTRRRRDEDPLIVAFRAKVPQRHELPHPHRCLDRVKIGWPGAISPGAGWLDVLFAAECMSQSARGLSLADTEGWPRAVRDAYTKLSAGHVSIDLAEADDAIRIPHGDVADPHTRGKISRVTYWWRRLRDARRKVFEDAQSLPGVDFNPDTEHPRVLAAVREITRWTSLGEKVLVFGVFLGPLRVLRDVLNVRYALQSADGGLPIPRAVHTDPSLFAIAVRQTIRLRAEGALKGQLAAGNINDLRRVLQQSHRTYERRRRQVRESIKSIVKSWRTDPTYLGGVAPDSEMDIALQDHIVSFILDDVLATASATAEPERERIKRLAHEFFKRHVRPEMTELDVDDTAVEEDEIAQVRREALRANFYDDQTSRQREYAALLDGDTRWSTRRYIQAAFNRETSSPRVLVAQSQVGREGLNLHEACRVVLQFHAEWNPAVLEQQVGRVDRKGSRWERLAQEWLRAGGKGQPPYIEVRQLVFEGTYDAFQWERVIRRQRLFDASLFGALLPADAWARVPVEYRNKLRQAAPDFTPQHTEVDRVALAAVAHEPDRAGG